MKLEIELTYQYNTLDKKHEFGIVTNSDYSGSVFDKWVWYYLGFYLKENKTYGIFQWRMGGSIFKAKVLKKYSGKASAQTYAKLIANRINKIIA